MQIIATIIILGAAIAYAGWAIVRAIRRKDPCADCEMKKNCKKFGSVKDNSYLCTRI